MKTRWRMFGSLLACLILVISLFSPLRADRTASFPLETAIARQTARRCALPAGLSIRLLRGSLLMRRRMLVFRAYPGDGTGYYIVQFDGPIAAIGVDDLEAAGVAVFDYIPDYAFIVKMDDASRAAVEGMAFGALGGRVPACLSPHTRSAGT